MLSTTLVLPFLVSAAYAQLNTLAKAAVSFPFPPWNFSLILYARVWRISAPPVTIQIQQSGPTLPTRLFSATPANLVNSQLEMDKRFANREECTIGSWHAVVGIHWANAGNLRFHRRRPNSSTRSHKLATCSMPQYCLVQPIAVMG
jgi:hypothetical protein